MSEPSDRAKAPAKAAGALVAKLTDRASPVPTVTDSKAHASPPAPAPAETAAASPFAMKGAPIAGKSATNAPVPVSDPLEAKPSQAALMLPANLKAAKVGDVVEALQQDGQQVAVVRLQVVNQVEGLDGVQSLLVRNTIQPLQNEDEIKRMRQQFAADKSAEVSKAAAPSAPGDLICVYAEGPREEMLRVLLDLQKESHIREAELTNTIATLEEFANSAVPENAQGGQRSGSNTRNLKGSAAQASKSPGSQLAVSLPAATVNKILSSRQPSAVVLRRQPQSAQSANVAQSAGASSSALPTFQYSKPQTGKDDDSARYDQRQAVTAPARSLAKQGKGSELRRSKEVAGAQESFQIFFVITDRPMAQSPSQAPNAASPMSSRPAPNAGPAGKPNALPVPAKAAR